MKEFALIFRNSTNAEFTPSPDQMQEVMTSWMNWMGSLGAQGILADKGNRLGFTESKTVKPNNVVTDGPYTEIKEFISGYIVLKTATLDDAVEIAKGCPVFKVGGNVEVRGVVDMNDNN